MDYAEARAAFFQPRSADAPPAATAEWTSPARDLRDAIEPLATVCFWSEPAYEAYAGEGLDFLQGYVWGRASVLGEPASSVVASSFGVFEPGLIAGLYDEARTVCSLGQVRAAKESGAITALRQTIGEPQSLPRVVTALRRGAAAADPTGRPMHAGATSLPWPTDLLGQLWHACTLLREHRGDGHLAACVAAGLNGLEANLLTELRIGWEPMAYTSSRGWPEDMMEAARDRLRSRGLFDGDGLTREGAELRDNIEKTTDRLLDPVVTAIGHDLPEVVDQLNAWSQQLVDKGWFPPDPYKRASG